MVGGVNDFDAPRSSPGGIRSVAPERHTPKAHFYALKHVIPALDLRRYVALTNRSPTETVRTGRIANPTPRFRFWPRFPWLRARVRRERRYFSRVAAGKSDEPGVLGNLPRSRPGHRSEKRGGGVRAAAAAGTAEAAKVAERKPAASPRPKPSRRKPAARKPVARKPAGQPQHERPQVAAQAETSSDPLTGAVRLAGKVAEAGLKTAGSILRRLPGR